MEEGRAGDLDRYEFVGSDEVGLGEHTYNGCIDSTGFPCLPWEGRDIVD